MSGLLFKSCFQLSAWSPVYESSPQNTLGRFCVILYHYLYLEVSLFYSGGVRNVVYAMLLVNTKLLAIKGR